MSGAAPDVRDPRLTAVLKDVAKLALTALFALSSGWVFSQFRLPVPYMLGSLIGVWVLGGLSLAAGIIAKVALLLCRRTVPVRFCVPV